jgi:Zn-dependent alcohol dehydrogenase
MEPIESDDTRGQVTRRRVISGIAGVGAAVIAGGTIARAQSTATPETGTDSSDSTGTTDTTSPETKKAEQYQTFLTKLSTELSISDTTTIDTGIRDALKSMVDDQVTAGDLAANDATEIKAEIDASVSPIKLGVGGHGKGGMRRGGGMSGGGMPGGDKPGDGMTDDDGTDDSSVATPTT